MNKDKLLIVGEKLNKTFSDKRLIRNLLDHFSSDEELDEMLYYLNSNKDLTKSDINTAVYRITLKKKGIIL